MNSIFLLGLALMAAAPANAAGGTAADRQSVTAPASDALALARLMSPRDLLVDMEVREFDRNFVASLRSDPELKSLDDEYPGVFDAMHKASRALVAEAMGRSVDKVQASVARVIEASFTPADMAELSDFYRSPLGQKTLQQMTASADASQLYQRAVQEPDLKLTEQQIAEQVHASARKTAQTFTPDEQMQMMLFMAKPCFGKLAKAQPQIQKILADEFNAPDPDFDRQVEKAMGAAIERHIASFERSGAK